MVLLKVDLFYKMFFCVSVRFFNPQHSCNVGCDFLSSVSLDGCPPGQDVA